MAAQTLRLDLVRAPLPDLPEHALARLAASEGGPAVLVVLLERVRGPLASPGDASMRLVIKRAVGGHADAVAFLRASGFSKDVDDPGDSSEAGRGALLQMEAGLGALPMDLRGRLTDAHRMLARHARAAGLAVPELPCDVFNPFQESRLCTGTARAPTAPAPAASTGAVRENPQEARQPDGPWDVQASSSWLSDDRRLEDAVREAAGGSMEEDKALVLAVSKGAGQVKFQSRRKDPSRTRKDELCILWVICPDKSMLQLRFHPEHAGAFVLECIGLLLAPHVQATRWYIYDHAERRRLDPEQTLRKAGLARGAKLHLLIDQGERAPAPPFLAAPPAGPAPREDRRGVRTTVSCWPACVPTRRLGSGRRLGGGPGASPQSPGSAAAPLDKE